MVDEIVTRQELIDAKRDAQDLGKAVNEKVIVSPRYGGDFKSLPMVSKEWDAKTQEAQSTINSWQEAINTIVVNDGVPALAVSTANGSNQQTVNDFGGVDYWAARSYQTNNEVRLTDGTVVISTIDNNSNNPNSDMTGWKKKNGADQIFDESGETQQQVNYNGGSNWHSRVGGYKLNERVVLTNGDIVKSITDGNTNDPNVDMTGWEFEGLSKSIYNPLNLNYTQQQLATTFTTSLNALIQKVSLSGGGTISIPDGLFPVDVAVGITLLDDVELRFGKNTILKALAHNSPQHEILRIHDVNNVTVSGGGMIDGNKSQNSATIGEWGMGVSIRGADNIHISDLKVKDTWGDGFYIGRTDNRAFSSRVTLDRVGSDSSRRNGLSVISVKELDVNDSSFDNSITMEPKCGVDIEPNYADEFIQGVRFKNLKTSGNNIGLNLYLAPLIGTNAVVTVDINGWTDRNSRRENFANRNYLPDSSGYISINGFTAINEEQSNGSMLALYSIAKTGMAFRLKNIALSSKITNTDNPYVRIGRFDTAATGETMGNIEIDGISARTLNGTLPINAIILNALPATSRLEGVTIGNIGKLDATSPIRSVSRVSELTIKNENWNFFRSLPAGQSTVSINTLYPLYIRDSSVSSSVAISADLPSGFEFEIRNAVAGSLDVNVSLITLVSNKLGGTGSLRCSTVGGFIKLKSLGGGVVEYISSYGYTQDGATASTAQAAISVPANSQMLLKSINLSGITTSDPVAVSYSVPAAGLNIWAACEVNGSVNVYAVNHTAVAISLPAGTIKVNRL